MHWEKSEIDKCNSAFIAPTILNFFSKVQRVETFQSGKFRSPQNVYLENIYLP